MIGEELERDRRNPNKKFLNSEADEVAFGFRNTIVDGKLGSIQVYCGD